MIESTTHNAQVKLVGTPSLAEFIDALNELLNNYPDADLKELNGYYSEPPVFVVGIEYED